MREGLPGGTSQRGAGALGGGVLGQCPSEEDAQRVLHSEDLGGGVG